MDASIVEKLAPLLSKYDSLISSFDKAIDGFGLPADAEARELRLQLISQAMALYLLARLDGLADAEARQASELMLMAVAQAWKEKQAADEPKRRAEMIAMLERAAAPLRIAGTSPMLAKVEKKIAALKAGVAIDEVMKQ